MQRGHGMADRLRPEDVDLDFIDELVASGGAANGAALRGEATRTLLANNFLGPNRFGRMFPDLTPFRPPRKALEDLGLAMQDESPGDPTGDNRNIAAGFTYLGQFIDHDITRDGTENFPKIDDTELIRQLRTPTLDLDSLYGAGPRRNPELYTGGVAPEEATFTPTQTIPVTNLPPNANVAEALPNDVPRRTDGSPLIGDDRNDENLVVAQTHLAFQKFHNSVLGGLPGGGNFVRFNRARRLVRWHYQWIVMNDFLVKICDAGVLSDIRENGRRFYDFSRQPFDGTPFMPIEFSAAAYRFGHSMVREEYDYNRVFSDPQRVPNALTVATLGLLFRFTKSGGDVPIPSNWPIDWRRFFRVGQEDLRNFTRRIDTKLIPQLHKLPTFSPGPLQSLAVRNLLRGSRIGLPSGQDVAELVGATPLSAQEVSGGSDGQVVRDHGLDAKTPLWYYVLKEAEVRHSGERLGEVGSRIVGEVFLGLLEGSPNSFLTVQPDWKPELPSATPGNFRMADLLRFVDDINPVG